MKNGPFVLTEKQRKAFARLKAAHAACLESGIEFYNNYGTLGAVCADKFERDFYNDRKSPDAVQDDGVNALNEMSLECSEWADDQHWFHPKTNAAGHTPAAHKEIV